jgi:hypothetical protein
MALLLSVTAPVWAIARPFNEAPLLKTMEVSARMFPLKAVVVSMVADETTRHQILHGSPPVIDEPGEVISDEADLNIQTPEEPVRVKFPVRVKAGEQ